MRIALPALVLTLGAIVLPAPFATALLFEDYFDSLEAWDCLDMKGDATYAISESHNAPPGFGDSMLHVEGDDFIALVKDLHLSDGTLLVLYRECSPVDFDADGVLAFRAQYGDDIGQEHNAKQAKAMLWFEQDNDSGLHFVSRESDAKETPYAETGGLALITEDWNQTGWIFHKVEMKGAHFRGKFWPATAPEPAAWIMEADIEGPAKGRLGFRMGSAKISVAYFAVDSQDIPAPRIPYFLYPEQERISQIKQVPLTLFTQLLQAEEASYTLSAYQHQELLAQNTLHLEVPAGTHRIALNPGQDENNPHLQLPSSLEDGLITFQLEKEGRLLDHCAVQLISQEKLLSQVQALSESCEKIEKLLQQNQQDTQGIRVLLDAARGELSFAQELFSAGRIDAGKRALSYAEEALAELQGYKGAALGKSDAPCPPLPSMAQGERSSDEKKTDYYSPDFSIQLEAATLDTQSLVMGESSHARLTLAPVGAPPQQPFDIHLRLSSPYGHRTIASATKRERFVADTPLRLDFDLAVKGERDLDNPAEPGVLDEYYSLLLTIRDSISGAPLCLDASQWKGDTVVSQPPGRPGSDYPLGAYFVSSTPITIQSIQQDTADRLAITVDYQDETPWQGHALLQISSADKMPHHTAIAPLGLEGPAQRIVRFDLPSHLAGPYELHIALRDQHHCLTEARQPITLQADSAAAWSVQKENHTYCEAGCYFNRLHVHSQDEGVIPDRIRVYGEGRLLGEKKASKTVEAEPFFGYYDIEILLDEQVYWQRVIATVVETEGMDLLLNGEPFLIKGVNVHSLDGASPERSRIMMRILKERGFNMLRGDYPPPWQLDMALEMGLGWTVLAPFSCCHTDEIFARQEGPPLATARALSTAFLEKYKDKAAALLWNSSNELNNEIDHFLISTYPVYKHVDPYERPVHYANLFGQDRWRGQDAMGINYYFGEGQQAQDRGPIIQRSIDIARRHQRPVFYTEYNGYQGPIHSTGVDALYGMFDWGLKQGMSGGFFYMKNNSSSHPGVFGKHFGTHRLLDEALYDVFADIRVDSEAVTAEGLPVLLKNKRPYHLRRIRLELSVNGRSLPALEQEQLAPKAEAKILLTGIKEELKDLLIEGSLEYSSHHGLRMKQPVTLLCTQP